MKKEVHRLFRKRWDALLSPQHCAAFALDLEFQKVKFNIEVRSGLREVCMVLLGEEDAKNIMLSRGFGASYGLLFGEKHAGVAHVGEYPELQKVARVFSPCSLLFTPVTIWSAFYHVYYESEALVYVFTVRGSSRDL